MNEQILKSIYARAMGELTLRFLESVGQDAIVPVMESKALDVISQIKAILDDETLNDRECFQRIEAVVNVFEANGIDTTRHDW